MWIEKKLVSFNKLKMDHIDIFRINSYDVSKSAYKRIYNIIFKVNLDKQLELIRKHIFRTLQIIKILPFKSSLKSYLNQNIEIFKRYKMIIKDKKKLIEKNDLNVSFKSFIANVFIFKKLNKTYYNRKDSKKYIKAIFENDIDKFAKIIVSQIFEIFIKTSDTTLLPLFENYFFKSEDLIFEFTNLLYHHFSLNIKNKDIYKIIGYFKNFDNFLTSSFLINFENNFFLDVYKDYFLFPSLNLVHYTLKNDNNVESIEKVPVLYLFLIEFEKTLESKYEIKQGIISNCLKETLNKEYIEFLSEEISNKFKNVYVDFVSEPFKVYEFDTSVLDSVNSLSFILQIIFKKLYVIECVKENKNFLLEKNIIIYYIELYLKYLDKENYKEEYKILLLNSIDYIYKYYKNILLKQYFNNQIKPSDTFRIIIKRRIKLIKEFNNY